MSDVTSRKYIKTKFEGFFYRQSAKRDPRTNLPVRIYCFCFTDTQGKGHWKTVGRHSKGIRSALAQKERAKFLAEIAVTDINPVERKKVAIGDRWMPTLHGAKAKESTLVSIIDNARHISRTKFTHCPWSN